MSIIMNEEEFLGTYEKYKRDVYSVIFNYVRNPEDASELTQETFIKYLNSNVLFESDEHEKAWLLRVSINLCKNHLRSMKHISQEEISEDIPYMEQYGYGELLRIVMTLPEKYRVPIHLFYYEDYSISEIADVTDTPEATVKTHLKRGKEKLGKMLQKEDWLVC